MGDNILKTYELTKKYKNVKAVDEINMLIKKGDIYGLIGKNGAGKTTLIRMITNLTPISSGRIELFGSEQNLNNSRDRIGSIVESPALYKGLSAYENLEYYRLQRGIPNKSIIKESLELVGLSDTKNKKVKNFSLGMKQRLGLAVAMLGNPDFIILDEPINGLDPIGISEMRSIIKKLNEELGITVLISSHILSELSQIATKYGIIDNGKLIKQITKEELDKECKRSISIDVDDTKKAIVVLEEKLKTTNYIVVDAGTIRVFDYLDTPSDLNFALVSNGVKVNFISEIGMNLEDYFKKCLKEGE
ncbi:MAG: ABC transporter ATP-binding protein [Lachnospiraceae bacterium]|jgi:ABC-2 type transport system ATP-binding protein|nr:ABC transporter ATP-binding protein [Lachnospiraceae bacterium]